MRIEPVYANSSKMRQRDTKIMHDESASAK